MTDNQVRAWIQAVKEKAEKIVNQEADREDADGYRIEQISAIFLACEEALRAWDKEGDLR